ncbi:MAG: glycosyltransferase family 4 protein [Candidatus Binataceae bacterium]
MNTDRRISVMHFASEPVRGGAEEHMLMLLTHLDRERFRPILAAVPRLIKLLQPDLPRDIEAIPVNLRGAGDLHSAWRFERLLATRRIDILHSHMFQASRLASPLGWLARVPVVIETSHGREHWRKGFIKGSYVIDRFAACFVTAFIAVSKANGEYLRNEKRLPAEKIFVIQNGSPLERFDPERIAPPELRARLGIDQNAPVVLVLARLEPQKGHRVLLEAWKSVARSYPAARLVLAGDGVLRAELEAQTATLGITGSVSFVGQQSNIPDWLALADFTVLPSFYEGLPLAAIESLAAGRPVVATAVDGTVEVVLDGKTGLTVPAGDSAALATAISRMLATPELVRSLGHAGRQFVLKNFSRERQIQQTESLYLDAWHRSRRGRVPDSDAHRVGTYEEVLTRQSK